MEIKYTRTYQAVKILFGDTDDSDNTKEDDKDNAMLKQFELKDWDVNGRIYLGFNRRRAMWDTKVKTI